MKALYYRALAAAALAMVTGSIGPIAGELPNGATSLSENYNAWKVSCATVKSNDASSVRCSLSQSIVNQKTKRPVFNMRLALQKDESVKGQITVPLGISLKDGAQFQIDDGPKTDPYTYSTCIRRGCVVQFDWSKKTLSSMQGRKRMNVIAKALNGKEVKFGIRLEGLDKALSRVEQLVKG